MADIAKTTLKRIGEEVERPRIRSYLLQSIGISLGLTATFYLSVVFLLGDTYMATMFTERGPIPYMTTYLAFMGLALLGGSCLLLSRESRNFKSIAAVLREAPYVDAAGSTEIGRKIGELIQESEQVGLVFSRVQRVLRRVENRGNAGDVSALLSEQAEIDRAILSNSYGLVRFIGWLIPVLGFIGTVGGISFAIAQFPELFKGGAEAMQEHLGPITGNLGVAFETTFLALIKVAIILFVLFVVQKRGNDLLNTFDEFCLDNLLGKVRGGGIAEEETGPFGDLARVLSQHVEKMEEKFEKAAQDVVARLVEGERERWAETTDTLKTISREHEEAIRSSFAAATDNLEAVCKRQEDSVSEACKAMVAKSEQLASGLRQWEPQFSKSLSQGEALQDAVDHLNRCLENDLAPALREIQKRRRMQVQIVDEVEEE